ncbi:MAG: EamA family transporter, partial [Pseudomonadales bacterium]|nr:EamA family transporter [Pseudomonadales bacterium]
AFSFGFYGLIRKRLAVDSLVGLTVESWLLLPLALAYLAVNAAAGRDAFTASMGDALKLVFAGPITMLPLLCFAAAAVRLQLGTLGFFQYLAPSLQFVLAVLVFHEPVVTGQWYTFGLIWTALLLFTISAVLLQLRARRRFPLDPAAAP